MSRLTAVTLRPLHGDDAFTLALILDDEATRRLARLPFGGSLRDVQSFIGRRLTQLGQSWVVLADGEPAGYASLTPQPASLEVELVFALAAPLRGVGLGALLCALLLDVAHRYWPQHRPYARCDATIPGGASGARAGWLCRPGPAGRRDRADGGAGQERLLAADVVGYSR